MGKGRTVNQDIGTLERRAEYLQKRIGNASRAGRDLTFDKRELSALRRAIERMKDGGTQSRASG